LARWASPAPQFSIHPKIRKLNHQVATSLSSSSASPSIVNFRRRQPPNTDTMAPQKKSKKDANSINSKLALVMKSGKGMLAPACCNCNGCNCN